MTGGRAEWPIVVGGCHRSGTSLLRRMLDAHPHIHCGPEVLFFRDFHGAYRDDPIAHLRYAATARSVLPEDDLLEVLGGAFVEVHERAARRVGKRRWADKAPENVLHAGAWDRLLGERWLLLHVVRDPRDTLASMRERPMPATLPADEDERAGWWVRHVEAGLDAVAQRPERGRVVLYEDLVTNPEATLGALMTWLGEPLAPEQLAFNRSPHQPGLEDPKVAATDGAHTGSIGRWREAMTTAEADTVLAVAGEAWSRATRAAAA